MTILTEDRRRELLAERSEISEKTFRMPDAASFDDLFELLGTWGHERFNHRWGERPAERPRGAVVTVPNWARAGQVAVEIGPYCSVRRPGNGYGSLAVRPTPGTLEALHPFIIGDLNASWSFEIIDHGEIALVTAHASQIISSIWLAYINPETIPVMIPQ